MKNRLRAPPRAEAAFGVDGSFNTAGDRTRIASALSGAFTPGAVEGGGDVRGDIGETRNAGSPGGVARGAHRRRLSARARAPPSRANHGGGASGGGARRRRRARSGGADGRREDVARLGAGGVAVQALRRPGPVRARGRARARPPSAAGDGVDFQKSARAGARARRRVKKNERTKGTKGKKKRLFWGLLTAPLLTNAKPYDDDDGGDGGASAPPISFSNVSDEAEAFLPRLVFQEADLRGQRRRGGGGATRGSRGGGGEPREASRGRERRRAAAAAAAAAAADAAAASPPRRGAETRARGPDSARGAGGSFRAGGRRPFAGGVSKTPQEGEATREEEGEGAATREEGEEGEIREEAETFPTTRLERLVRLERQLERASRDG